MVRRDRGGVGPVERGVALGGLAVAAPALALAAAAIKLSSPGPVLYRATRVGRGGSPFTMLKLRTMHPDAERLGQITGSRDSRVFAAGRILRRLKLDELPQLANVVRGEMAFVGPRPEAPEIVERYYRPWMRETLSVPPGIVGPGSLWYFAQEGSLPVDAAEAESYYVQSVLPRKLALELVFVSRPSLGYRWELVARTLLRIISLERLMEARRIREEAEAGRLLARLAVEERLTEE